MSLVATTRKLGISFFEYVRVGAARHRHRISNTGTIPSLTTIIRDKSSLNPAGRGSYRTSI
jgi:hypothetical protein